MFRFTFRSVNRSLVFFLFVKVCVWVLVGKGNLLDCVGGCVKFVTLFVRDSAFHGFVI